VEKLKKKSALLPVGEKTVILDVVRLFLKMYIIKKIIAIGNKILKYFIKFKIGF
jgi:hypothetical protein